MSSTLFKALLGLYLFAAMTLVVVYSFNDRSPGKVLSVRAENGSCSRGRNNSFDHRRCTHFIATVQYEALDRVHVVGAPAGRKVGENHPISYANYASGDDVTVSWTHARPEMGYVVASSFYGMLLCFLLLPFAGLALFLLLPRPDPSETYEELLPSRSDEPLVSLDQERP